MFSVVIPLYNKEHTIINTIKCVLEQTYQYFELIIVDDGSTDDSVKIIKEYTNDPRLKIIQQNNTGVSGARNKGVKHSNYNYIAFLDGDDEWFPTYLEKIEEAISKYSSHSMFCSAGMGKNFKGEYNPRQIDKFKDQVVTFDFFENPHVFLHISATVVTKELFYKANEFPLGMKRNEDFTFLYKAALISKPIYSGYPLSVYVGGVEGQATNTSIYDSKKLLQDTIDRYNLVYKKWEDLGASNKSFITFMKYELRHLFMVSTIRKEFSTNVFIMENLNNKILKLFTPFEINLLKNKSLSTFFICFIKFTKLRWRLRGFQVVK